MKTPFCPPDDGGATPAQSDCPGPFKVPWNSQFQFTHPEQAESFLAFVRAYSLGLDPEQLRREAGGRSVGLSEASEPLCWLFQAVALAFLCGDHSGASRIKRRLAAKI